MFAAHPILGVGLGGYWIGITAYHDASGLMTPQEAHNDYLELLSSGGVIGLALGIWFVVTVIKKTRENFLDGSGYMRAVRFGAILGIAGVAAHSLVDFGLHIMTNAVVFLTLIMIVTTGCSHAAAQRRREES
jgi:O-antigen ligase